jgi:hypothetical protein
MALVASKRETFRTDALQVRKRNPPTQINAGSGLQRHTAKLHTYGLGTPFPKQHHI